MRIRYFWMGLALTCSMSSFAMTPLGSGAGLSSPTLGSHEAVSDELPSRFFPGKYFEGKGQFYLQRKDYRVALQMFELSGYWADKISQYNAGIMYFSGIGIPVDKPRGVAWLRIAAETHEDLAENALRIASSELNDEQRAAADTIWQELDAKYGDKVALRRALARYAQDKAETTGSHLGFVGNLTVQMASASGAQSEIGSDYFSKLDIQRDELVSEITGHVSVGKVTTLPIADDAKGKASKTTINPSPATH